MKRSIFSFVALLVVAMMLLAACAPAATPPPAPANVEPTQAPVQATEAPTEAPKEAVTLRMLVRPDEGNNVADYAAKFEQETGIKVAVDFVSWADISNKTLTTLAAGGGGYDIVSCLPQMLPNSQLAAGSSLLKM